MENIFAKRRARLLAMKAMRENYVPGEKLVTCPHCGGESQRKDVAAALSVCPRCASSAICRASRVAGEYIMLLPPSKVSA